MSIDRAAADRLVELARRRELEQLVEAAEVVAEQAIEGRDRVVRVVVAEPPEPVGALADGELARSRFRLLGGQASARHHQVVAVLHLGQQIPRAVLVG